MLSPVLANLYLDRFDEEMIRRGYKLVRFADDFLILCKEQPKAEKALQLTESLLGELRLSLKPQKTRLVHFDQGFRYLGTLFLRTLDMPAPRKQEQKRVSQRETKTSAGTTIAHALGEALEKAGKTNLDFPANAETRASTSSARTVTEPSPLDSGPQTPDSGLSDQPAIDSGPRTSDSGLSDQPPLDSEPRTPHSELLDQPPNDEASEESVPTARRVQVPFRRTLYIQEQGSVLARDDERLVVKKEGEILLEVPAAKIDQIFIFGNCTITTPAMTYCLKEDIPIVLFSSRGSYYGIIDSPLGDNVSLHRQQFTRAADQEFCLATAKAIITAKLHNSRLLLQRHQRRKQIPVVTFGASNLT